MDRFVVDGMNVIGAQADGWWRDRDAAVLRLVSRLQQAAERSGAEVSVVLDGRPLADLPEGDHGGVAVHYSRRPGRDAADDRIVEIVAGDADPGALCVVTSDRDLVDRVRAIGARTEGARTFLRRLEQLDV
jgi:predicted RNA-binding protein with PIN domain